MIKKEDLFREHYMAIMDSDSDKSEEPLLTFLATEVSNITLAYHKKSLELVLEEWTKGKFQEPLNAIIRREIEELNK